MNIKEIQNLIKFVSKSGVAEVSLKSKDLELKIKNVGQQKIKVLPQNIVPQQAAPAPAAPAPQPKAEEAQVAPKVEDSNLISVKSPMIGTFYRSSGPDKDPFVKVGDTISEGDVLCIVEAMKLFNEIESEVSGKIVKILVDDSTPVEYDQPLFLIEP